MMIGMNMSFTGDSILYYVVGFPLMMTHIEAGWLQVAHPHMGLSTQGEGVPLPLLL